MTICFGKHSNSFTRNREIQSRPARDELSQPPTTPLFHLLISDAVSNWSQAHLRTALGRAFEHGTMKAASNRIQHTHHFSRGEDPRVVADLRAVVKSFVQLQEKRHVADYDNTTFWTRTEALAQVKSAEQAFSAWKRVRHEQIAQEYLISLLVKKRD